MRKVISFLMAAVAMLICFGSIQCVAESDDVSVIFRKSYTTKLTQWESYDVDAITTITRYSDGVIHFDVYSDSHSTSISDVPFSYTLTVTESRLLDLSNGIENTETYHFNQPMCVYGDDSITLKWTKNAEPYHYFGEYILSFDLVLNKSNIYSDIDIQITDRDGDTCITIPSKKESNHGDIPYDPQVEIDELKAMVEHKDTQIFTLNETIDALRSQIDFIKRTQPVCGDTDDDGRVSISDSIILNRYLAGTVDFLPCSDPPSLAPEDDLG